MNWLDHQVKTYSLVIDFVYRNCKKLKKQRKQKKFAHQYTSSQLTLKEQQSTDKIFSQHLTTNQSQTPFFPMSITSQSSYGSDKQMQEYHTSHLSQQQQQQQSQLNGKELISINQHHQSNQEQAISRSQQEEEEQALLQEKQRLGKLANLLNILNHKKELSSSSEQEDLHEIKERQEEEDEAQSSSFKHIRSSKRKSSINYQLNHPTCNQSRQNQHPQQKPQSQHDEQNAQISISSPLQKEKPHLTTKQPFYSVSSSHTHSGSKTKSKFAKQHINHDSVVTSSFDPQEPHIITSSHKTFFNSSKSSNNIKSNHNININGQQGGNSISNSGNSNNPNNMFLSPSSNTHSRKELTSAGNLLQSQQAAQHITTTTAQKSNRSGFNINTSSNIKSSTQTPKQATFAALPSKRSHHNQQPQQPSGGVTLYEQVLAKNFEVIDNLLRKLNQIYTHQQEYENTITQISQKLHKLEVDNENIHHEFRTSHFMIDKKLNSITNQYSNMLQDMNLMKKMWNQNAGGGKTGYFAGIQGNGEDDQADKLTHSKRKSATRKSDLRKSGRVNRKSSRTSIFNPDNPFTTSNPNHPSDPTKSSSHRNSITSHRRSTKKGLQQQNGRKSSNWMNLKGLDEQNLGKMLLEQINESSSWEGSDSGSEESEELLEDDGQRNGEQVGEFSQSVIYSNGNTDQQKGDSMMKHSKNQSSKMKNSSSSKKNSRFVNKSKRVSIDSFDEKQMSQLKSYISQQFIKMSSNSDQLKKFTQMGIEAMMVKKCEKLEEKIEEKFFQFRKEVLEEKIQKQFRREITEEIEQKTVKMIEKDLTSLRAELLERVLLLDTKVNKQIQRKCDKQEVRQDLKEILQSMNRKVNTLMDQCYHKFPQRTETKRAILFLQKKINKLVETAHKYSLQGSGETGDTVKCLSCSKNVGTMGGGQGHSHHHSALTQPMFAQVHLIGSQQREEEVGGFVKDFSMTARKNGPSNEKVFVGTSAKSKVKFTDITNLHQSSVDEIFQLPKTSTDPLTPQQPQPRQPPPSTPSDTPSSKQTFMKKLKNTQASDSLHFTSTTNLNKGKLLTTTQDNRPTTSMNGSVHDVSQQRNWKEKASTMLKKEANVAGGANWRSKSMYKKAV